VNKIKKHLLEVAKELLKRGGTQINFTFGEPPNILVCKYLIANMNLDFPPIFISTLPKSGSIYLLSTLRQLNLELQNFSTGVFPRSYINYKNIKVWNNPGYINVEHISADPVNLRMINFYCNKMIVHTRDPRQAVLSWVHHLPKMYEEEKEGLFVRTGLKLHKEYFTWDFSKRLDWYIKNNFIYWIDWIQQWVDAENNPDFKTEILFTSHQELSEYPRAFFIRITRFYGIPDKYFLGATLPEKKQGQLHFRKGLTNEWVDVFTDEQKEFTNKLIPKELKTRFGWLS
jgi:hypothetical protein